MYLGRVNDKMFGACHEGGDNDGDDYNDVVGDNDDDGSDGNDGKNQGGLGSRR